MNRRRLLLLMVAGLVAVVTAVRIFRTPEPSHQGKPLSHWLKTALSPYDAEHLAYSHAMQAMGTNIIPHVMPMLRAKDSGFKIKLLQLQDRFSWLPGEVRVAEERRIMATSALAALGPMAADVSDDIAALLQDPEIASKAGYVLGRIGVDALPHLSNALMSSNDFTRQAAFHGLIDLGTNAQSALPQLLACLHDPSLDVRRGALLTVRVVGAAQAESVVPAVLALLQSTNVGTFHSLADMGVFRNAADALASFGEQAREAIPILRAALHDRYRADSAIMALMRIAGAEAAPWIEEALSDPENSERQNRILTTLGYAPRAEEFIPVLVHYARSEFPDARLSAIVSLGRIARRPEEVLPVLIENLDHPDMRVVDAAARSLGAYGASAREAIPKLLELIEEQTALPGEREWIGWEMEWAARYNGALGIDLKDALFALRGSVFEALGKIDPDLAKKTYERFADPE